MDKNQAYHLFEQMIAVAKDELLAFTLSQPFSQEEKADKSLVTGCDEAIDNRLSQIAKDAGLQIVSEEGEHILSIVESGNYMTIDPIDGTLGYIDYVNYSLQNGGIKTFLQRDLGSDHDFCLLLGIVEDGQPRFGCVYNFITQEKILLDAKNKKNFLWKNDVRNFSKTDVVYMDQRSSSDLENSLRQLPDVTVIKQATLGLKSVYTIIDAHDSAVTVHLMQGAGIWDLLPAAVAAKVFGGKIYDAHGDELQFTKYIILPPTGAVIIKGERFQFVLDKIKE